MKVGVNLLLCSTKITREHESFLRFLKESGCDGVEVPVMGAGDYRETARMLDDLGLERTASMAFVNETENPASPDAAHRRNALKLLKRMLDWSAELGAEILCGPMFQTIGVFSGEGPTESEKNHAAEVLRSAADHSPGTILALEPLNRFECYLCNTLEDGADLVRRIDRPNAGVLFDTFHANIEERNPIEAIRRYGNVIRHVHCSANHRGIPGEDHIDWDGLFAALKEKGYDGWLTAEMFGRSLPEFSAAVKMWKDRFASPESAAKSAIRFIRGKW